jgi:hypothetical protein
MANRQTTPQPPFPGQPQQNMSGGLTLPQVITLVDKRLSTLENFMREQTTAATPVDSGISAQVSEVLEEYNSRFDIIADELANLKDMMLKLQSFTMEVNKTLMEERVRILTMTDEPVNTNNTFTSASEVESALYSNN